MPTKSRSHRLVIIILSLLVFRPLGITQDKQKPKDQSLHIETMMTAAEYKHCGLNKLSEDEIARLDAWLTKTIASASADSKPPKQVTTSVQGAIESEIEGEFNGWDGETIFKLTNGQIWQQAEYDYEYTNMSTHIDRKC